jgi:hypothetical protein
VLKHGGGFGCAVTSLVPVGTAVEKIYATLKTGNFLKRDLLHRERVQCVKVKVKVKVTVKVKVKVKGKK